MTPAYKYLILKQEVAYSCISRDDNSLNNHNESMASTEATSHRWVVSSLPCAGVIKIICKPFNQITFDS